jgi:hypothetical protein
MSTVIDITMCVAREMRDDHAVERGRLAKPVVTNGADEPGSTPALPKVFDIHKHRKSTRRKRDPYFSFELI